MKLFYRNQDRIVVHSQTEDVEQEQEDGTTKVVAKPLPDTVERHRSINAAKRISRQMQSQGHRFQRPA